MKTNDEARMNDYDVTLPEHASYFVIRHSSFVIAAVRHSSFVIRHCPHA